MKILDLAKNVDRSKKNQVSSFSLDLGLLNDECRLLDVCTCFEADEIDIKEYWLQEIRDNDTSVGITVYFLKDELIGITNQEGRKYYKTMKWVSFEMFEKTTNYLIELNKNEGRHEIEYVDCETEMPERYKLEFNFNVYIGDVAHHKKYGKVKIKDIIDASYNEVVIEIKKDVIDVIEIEELEFDYNLIKK